MERRINIVSVKPVKRSSARARTRLASDLGHAIAHQHIRVHYQPQFDLLSGRACGVEALARWMLDGQAMAPATFIPIAEHFGLINAIGVSVLHPSCANFAAWQAPGDLTLSVNLSPRQINANRVAQKLHQTFARFPVATQAGPVTFSASIGVTAVDASHEIRDASKTEELLRAADSGLYASKKFGGNQASSSSLSIKTTKVTGRKMGGGSNGIN